ncbi:S-protein-like 1, partial [Cucurbita argyrosperma subsp. sororia]
MSVHCRSQDDDLGLHTLPPTADFSWSFEANFFHTTLFWCRLQKGGGGGGVEAAFKVFWHDARLFEKCGWKNCVWIAKDDGIYIKNFAKGIDELSYTWEVGTMVQEETWKCLSSLEYFDDHDHDNNNHVKLDLSASASASWTRPRPNATQ